MATFKKALLKNSAGDNLFPSIASTNILYDTSGTTLETAYTNALSTLIDKVYPIGALYCSTKSTHPHTLFPNTYWKKLDGGNIIVGAGTYTDVNNVTCTFTAGQKNVDYWTNVSLGRDEMPNHTHNLYQRATSTGREGSDEWGDGTATNTMVEGGSAGHNNLMASTVVYMWERVATAAEESTEVVTYYQPAIPSMKNTSYLGYTVSRTSNSNNTSSTTGSPFSAFAVGGGSYKIINDDANGNEQYTTLTITFPNAIIPKYVRVRAESTSPADHTIGLPIYRNGNLKTVKYAFNASVIDHWFYIDNETDATATSLSFSFYTKTKGTIITVHSIEITETEL